MRDSADVEEKASLAAARQRTTAARSKKSSSPQTDALERENEKLDFSPPPDGADAVDIKPFSQDNLPHLSSNAHSCIGTQMRALYNDLLQEETPERFLKLLEQLDQKSQSR